MTKTKPVEMLEEAYAAGQRNFGENKVQEICAKGPQLPEDIRWHMIGHLQRNKVKQVIDKAVMMPGLRVAGLMTIAPYTPDAESNRPYFRQLRELSVDIKSKCIDNVTMDHLSMGMTGDYQVAIEEGATLIRVGTGIFGERNYD